MDYQFRSGDVDVVAIVDDDDAHFFLESLSPWRAQPRMAIDGTIYRYYLKRDRKIAAMRGGGEVEYVAFHRLILSAPDDMHVDHINGDGLDNRRCNLRLVTRSQNLANQRRVRANKSSRFKGVSWSRTHAKWVASICVDNKQTILGRFDDEVVAAVRYNAAAVQSFGEFAFLNEMEGVA